MKKRNKIINIALIFILIGVFLWIDVVYSFNISCLRVSMDMPEMKRRQERLARRIEVSKFLESVDSAPSDRKARLVINATSQLNQMVWKNKRHDIPEKKLDQIKDRHSGFLRLYTRQHKLPLSLQGYVSIDCKSLVRIADDMYAAIAFINTKMQLLTLPKNGDFKFIPAGSESEIIEYQKNAEEFTQRVLPGDENKDAREKAEKGISELFNRFESAASDRKALEGIREFLGGRSDHPDLPFASLLLGSPESKVLQLETAKPLQIEAKTKEKAQTLSELAYEALLKPIESLIKRDENGRPRALTKEEMLLAYKEGALQALATSRDQERAGLEQWIGIIEGAIEANNMLFKHQAEGGMFTDEVSFPKIREDAYRNILTAATIPRDGKTWVFLADDMNLYQAAYALTKMLGIDQKMAIIDLDREDSYKEKDPLSAVIQETRPQDKIIESEIEAAEKWLDFHNRFLQKLHYSYKVDVRFRKKIDSLRKKALSQIKPVEGESFRLIAGDAVTAFALEFAVRTGEKPLIANPYITDHLASLINEEVGIQDDPYYFMSHSELYKRYRDRFEKRHYLLFDNNIINDWQGRPELIGGTRHLKSALRTIFTYNEIIAFLSDEKDKKAANPSIEPYQTTRFSLPGADFTRPGEEEAFTSMSSAQLFQAVEGCSQGKWDRHRDDILNRYSYLAVRGEIKPDAFMEHISKLAEKDFHIAWDKDRKSGNEGHGYDIKRAERTRAVIETVLRYSKPDFLNDEFLVNYYSEADEIKDDGAFIYFKRNYFGKEIPGQVPQSQAINDLVGDYDHPGPMDAFPLHALAMIMDISPQRIGPKMMNLFVAMTEAAEDRFSLYREDENMWYEDSYGVAPVLGIPFDAFNEHPEYYAKLLLESSLSPELLEFLIRPETAPQSTSIFSSSLEFGEREKEFGSFLSEIMIQEMIRQNSVEGNEFKLLKTIIGDSPKIASDVIIKLWRRFDIDELNSLLGLGAKVTDTHLERMEALFTEQNLNNRAVALFLTIYPDFDIELAKRLNRLFQDDSVQVIFGLLRAVRSRQWTGEEVNALYRTNLWSFTSPNVRHCSLQQILKLSKENRNKFFIAFSGKELKPQNVSDIYPLNIPDNHALYGQYRHELKSYSMDFSSFVRDEIRPESRESEEDVRRRATHRSRLLFNDLEAVLRLPQEELSRRVELLDNFETNSAELDNTVYRLLMVIPKEHFDELHGILKDNFAGLKNLKRAKREMTARFQEIVKLNPELKDYAQKTIVRWAAEQLGITSRRRFTEPAAGQNIKKAYLRKLAEDDLGKRVTTGKAGEEENKKFRTLSATNKLLLTIAENLRFYRSWLEEIPDVETDPGRMLSAAVMQGL